MNIVSLFAGCGGLDKGFEQAGFSVIWANEFDETIHATYRLNHPKTELNTSDIRTLSGKDIPDCDGIIGGPPCQAWSEGGKGLGILDPRGQLFLDYIRIVKEKKPKFFLIENVRGILDERHKESLDTFLSELSTAGYRISYELLNAADYKIPQDRYRVFFIGIRKDLKNKFIFPDPACGTPITLRKAIGDITEPPRLFCDERVLENNPVRANHDVYNGPYDAKYIGKHVYIMDSTGPYTRVGTRSITVKGEDTRIMGEGSAETNRHLDGYSSINFIGGIVHLMGLPTSTEYGKCTMWGIVSRTTHVFSYNV